VNLKKVWNDPVWSKVIAAGIVGGLGIAYVSYKHWWSVIWHGITNATAFLGSQAPVRHWVFGILLLGTLLAVVLLIAIAAIVIRAKKGNQSRANYLTYTSDHFFGLKWAWTYEGTNIELKAVLCARCDYQVGPDSASMFDSRVRFHCDSCGHTVPVEGQSWDSLQSVVMRLVQQKLRTGKYPKLGNQER
jgi:hypothetical protein